MNDPWKAVGPILHDQAECDRYDIVRASDLVPLPLGRAAHITYANASTGMVHWYDTETHQRQFGPLRFLPRRTQGTWAMHLNTGLWNSSQWGYGPASLTPRLNEAWCRPARGLAAAYATLGVSGTAYGGVTRASSSLAGASAPSPCAIAHWYSPASSWIEAGPGAVVRYGSGGEYQLISTGERRG